MNKSSEQNIAREMQNKCTLINSAESHCTKLDKDIQRSNNNDEDFESEYPNESGRISGGSRESAFSSNDENHSSPTGSSSGAPSPASSDCDPSSRSNSPADSEVSPNKVLNEYSNILPEKRETLELVDTLRVRFLDCLKSDSGSTDSLYDPLDIKEIRKPLPSDPIKQIHSLAFRLISRFTNVELIEQTSVSGNDEKLLDEAVKNLSEFLKYRHHYKLSSSVAEQYSKEFYILNGCFPFGHDKQGLPVLYLRARVHRRWSPKLDETFRRYVAWQIDTITKSYHGAEVVKAIGTSGRQKDGSFGIVFDCLHVSYSCLDMDFLRFLVKLLVQYYPTYCRYALCVDLPWLFRSVWKLVRSWLPEDAQNTVQLIVSGELTDYIDKEQIPNSIKFDERRASEKPIENKHKFPENYDSIKDISEWAKEWNVSSNEVKQLKAHVEKVRKEYEQLGAL